MKRKKTKKNLSFFDFKIKLDRKEPRKSKLAILDRGKEVTIFSDTPEKLLEYMELKLGKNKKKLREIYVGRNRKGKRKNRSRRNNP